MNELALFAGAGGGILGGKILGWRTVCAVEFAAYPRSVLLARQRDGILEPFPIWDDVRTFDGKPWRGRVDVVSGGFPCQDISIAGNGDGLDGERSGLWKEMGRIIGEVRPRFVLVENSPMLVIRGLNRVLGDIAALGYDARWGIIGADAARLPHRRKRIWVLCSDANQINVARCREKEILRFPGLSGVIHGGMGKNESGLRGLLTPGLCRTFNGVADQVDRIGAIGNGQVPAVVALAWRILSQ